MNPFLESTFDKSQWFSALRSLRYLLALASVLVVGSMLSCYLGKFLLYKETVIGSLMWDPITSNFAPIDLNPYIFYLTVSSVALGYATSIWSPRSLLKLLYAFAIVNFFRVVVLYLVNLEPPQDIIALYDPLLECTFYEGVVITKDLFFSGHTSNIIIFAFLTQAKSMKWVFVMLASVVGVMLVLQHVHYCIDIIAAPAFAYLAYRIADYFMDFLCQKEEGA